MISFSTKILRFKDQGEKTGWSYIEISKRNAQKLNPGSGKSFRVKGTLDTFALGKTSVLPMGDGKFILPINAKIRKGTGKAAGDSIQVQLALDERPLELSKEFLLCLKDDERAYAFFATLPKGHQNYFSKWIDSAKTIATKTKRITMAIIALAQQQGFPEMLRSNKNKAD